MDSVMANVCVEVAMVPHTIRSREYIQQAPNCNAI
jgi:hypothetical protein